MHHSASDSQSIHAQPITAFSVLFTMPLYVGIELCVFRTRSEYNCGRGRELKLQETGGSVQKLWAPFWLPISGMIVYWDLYVGPQFTKNCHMRHFHFLQWQFFAHADSLEPSTRTPQILNPIPHRKGRGGAPMCGGGEVVFSI